MRKTRRPTEEGSGTDNRHTGAGQCCHQDRTQERTGQRSASVPEEMGWVRSSSAFGSDSNHRSSPAAAIGVFTCQCRHPVGDPCDWSKRVVNLTHMQVKVLQKGTFNRRRTRRKETRRKRGEHLTNFLQPLQRFRLTAVSTPHPPRPPGRGC